MKKQILIAACAFAVQFANAQFSLEGEFRPRSEVLGNGQSSSALEDSDPRLQTSVRAALKAKYTTETYNLYTSFQEVFLVGDRSQISASGNGNFRVQEAWADLKLTDELRFKIGRQPLSYDDQRILGGLGWAQQARTHDIGILKYNGKDNGFKVDAGYSVNTIGDNNVDVSTNFSYRDLGFIHANKKFGNSSLSALILGTIFQNEPLFGDEKAGLVTAGLHYKGKFGKLGLAANAYIQDGERISPNGVIDDVDSAYLLSLDASYKATDKVTILAGAELISGTDDGARGFFPLYGTNHKFNGFMDRFYVGNHANGNGLVDLHLGGKFNLGSGFSLLARGHNFSEESGDSNTIGQEIDLVLAKKFKQYKLVLGYSQFIENDEFYDTDANKGSQNWAWAMLIIKPKFLGGAKKAAPKKL